MPSLPFFADARDAKTLVDWLNSDPEIAFLVPDDPPDPQAAYVDRVRALLGAATEAADLYPCFTLGDACVRQRWKAVRTVVQLRDGKHSLWHVPSGPPPLPGGIGPEPTSPDPWSGWTDHRPGADPNLPNLVPGHPAEIYLELWTRHRPYSRAERASLPALHYYWTKEEELLVVSSFGWVGDQSNPAPSTAWSWWRRLEDYFVENAIWLAGAGRDGCWAFRSALEKLKGGIACETRGWNSDPCIRAAH
jgi:hypothetical protein